MGRAESKIRKAIAAKGYTVDWITWDPVGSNVEMMGRDGGWSVCLNESCDVLLGYNAGEIIQQIESLPMPSTEEEEMDAPTP